MERPCFRFAALPSDLFTRICGFVDSADLLALSQVNRHCFHDLVGPNSDVWRSRLPPRAFADNSKLYDAVRALVAPPRLSWRSPFDWIKAALTSNPEPSYKELYFASRSIRFRGTWRKVCRFPPVPYDREIPETIALTWTAGSFSLDVWFVLPRSQRFSDGTLLRTRITREPVIECCDGILLSATITRGAHGEARGHAFIEVLNRNLYCSMVEDRPIVAQGLSHNRWYHLALSFDHQGEETGTQCVYLDGELVHTTVSPVHPAWSRLPTKRIGNGFHTDNGIGTKWSYFRGVIDDFRLWNGVLRPDNVQQILHGHETENSDVVCQWSIKRDCVFNLRSGEVTFVRCRRPLEGRAYHEDADVLELWRQRNPHLWGW